jgi:heme exporter protein B
VSAIRPIVRIVAKDVVTEIRSKENLTAMIIFALLVLVIFNFAIETGSGIKDKVAPGVLWVAFTFAGILGLNRAFAAEKENGCLQGMLLSPVDRSWIFLGKMAGNALFMFAMELLILPPFFVFFNKSFALAPLLLIPMVLATIGFTSVGTLFSAISVATRSQETVLPILLFPVVVPILIAAVEASGGILRGEGLTDQGLWITLMTVFAIVFTAISVLVFEHVVEE